MFLILIPHDEQRYGQRIMDGPNVLANSIRASHGPFTVRKLTSSPCVPMEKSCCGCASMSILETSHGFHLTMILQRHIFCDFHNISPVWATGLQESWEPLPMSITWVSHRANNIRLVNRTYPTNMTTTALRQAVGGQPSHGGPLPLIHWVAQRWAARWASRGVLEAGHL